MALGQEFQYLHWVLGLHKHFLPQQLWPVGALLPKLRFTQSSGVNECRANLSRQQNDFGKSTLGLLLEIFAGTVFNILTNEVTGHLVNVLI